MQTVVSSQTEAAKDTDLASSLGHRFVVNMSLGERDVPQIRSCEVIGPHHRNRFTFASKLAIEDVFTPDIAEGVAQCLASLSGPSEVLSLPNVYIETPGLTLARAHVMATPNDDGRVAIILRFKLVLGAVTKAFRAELGIEDSVQDHSANMSAMVLTDIVMPLLDLCAIADSGGLVQSDAFDEFMDTLIDRSQDVRFQAELIKRFVASTSPGRPQAKSMSQLF